MSDAPLRLDQTDQHDWNGDRDRVMALYAQRFSATYISQYTGISIHTVRKILHSELKERNQKRQDIVLAQRQTIDWMIKKVTQRIEKAKDNWDRRDAELLLKYLEREARAFGTDEPTQHNVQVTVEELSEDELITQLAASGYALQIAPPQTPQLPPAPIDDATYEPAEDRSRVGQEAAPEGSQ